MSRTRTILIFALALLFSLLVSACGGGGDGETNATGSQWDQMSWDQGKWG